MDPGAAGAGGAPPAGSALERLLGALWAQDAEGYFREPVTEDVAPGYFKVIARPMCLAQMRERAALGGGALPRSGYQTLRELREDFELICNNALSYNQKRSKVHKAAQTFLRNGRKTLRDMELAVRKELAERHPGGREGAVAAEREELRRGAAASVAAVAAAEQATVRALRRAAHATAVDAAERAGRPREAGFRQRAAAGRRDVEDPLGVELPTGEHSAYSESCSDAELAQVAAVGFGAGEATSRPAGAPTGLRNLLTLPPALVQPRPAQAAPAGPAAERGARPEANAEGKAAVGGTAAPEKEGGGEEAEEGDAGLEEAPGPPEEGNGAAPALGEATDGGPPGEVGPPPPAAGVLEASLLADAAPPPVTGAPGSGPPVLAGKSSPAQGRAARPLNPEWEAMRSDVAWRMKWIERRVLELRSQEAHYAFLEKLERAGSKPGLLEAAPDGKGKAAAGEDQSTDLAGKETQPKELSCARARPLRGVRRSARREREVPRQAYPVALGGVAEVLAYLAPLPAANSRGVPLTGCAAPLPEDEAARPSIEPSEAYCDAGVRAEILLSAVQSLSSQLSSFKSGPSSRRHLSISAPITGHGIDLVGYWRRGLAAITQESPNDLGVRGDKRRRGDFDIDEIVIPASGFPLAKAATPLRVEFINTPKVRDVGFVDDLPQMSNKPANSEDTTDTAYVKRHRPLEMAEQARFLSASSARGPGATPRGGGPEDASRSRKPLGIAVAADPPLVKKEGAEEPKPGPGAPADRTPPPPGAAGVGPGAPQTLASSRSKRKSKKRELSSL